MRASPAFTHLGRDEAAGVPMKRRRGMPRRSLRCACECVSVCNCKIVYLEMLTSELLNCTVNGEISGVTSICTHLFALADAPPVTASYAEP